MEKNQEFKGLVIANGANGEGIVKNGDITVFVPFAIIDEKIKYKILKVQKNIAYGKLLEVIEPSKFRVEPVCKVFYKCGGCDLQHIQYDKQLEIKRQNIKNCFRKIANIDIEPETPIQSSHKYSYRNKLQLPIQFDGEKNIIGFYAENSHRVIPLNDCPINPKWTKDIIKSTLEFMNKFNLKGQFIDSNKGDLREITIKEAGGLIITIVGFSDNLSHFEDFVKILKNYIDFSFTLYYNKNTSQSNVIYGNTFKLLYGEPNYISIMNDIKYRIGVLSFMQVNTDVCKKLYEKVLDLIPNNSLVIDAYSGAGLMTAMFAKKTGKAIGIEIIKEAVDNANILAKENGLENNIKNYCGKCEEILPKIIKDNNNEDTFLVLDPPRKGCDIKVIESISNCNIKRIAYISCMPQTLSRDIGLIIGTLKHENNEIKRVESPTLKYKLNFIQPFDMFPQTKHIETLCYLEKI